RIRRAGLSPRLHAAGPRGRRTVGEAGAALRVVGAGRFAVGNVYKAAGARMNSPFGPPEPGDHRLGPMQSVNLPMRRYRESEAVDYCIVGVGAAGGLLLQRLARAGFRVVGLEAGPFWDTERDWVSDEAGSHKLYWNELRITGGADPIALGANNSGHGVGGGSVHWAAFVPRFHPSDFRVY